MKCICYMYMSTYDARVDRYRYRLINCQKTQSDQETVMIVVSIS